VHALAKSIAELKLQFESQPPQMVVNKQGNVTCTTNTQCTSETVSELAQPISLGTIVNSCQSSDKSPIQLPLNQLQDQNSALMYEHSENLNLYHSLPFGCTITYSVKRKIWDNEYIDFRSLLPESPDKKKKLSLYVEYITQHDLCQIFIESAKTTFGTKLCKNKKYNYRKQIGNPKPWLNVN